MVTMETPTQEVIWTPQHEMYHEFRQGITLFEGVKGSGKTASAICIMKGIKDYFGMESVSSTQLKKGYGKYQYLSVDDFVESLRALSKGVNIAKNNENAREVLQKALDRAGFVNLIEKGILLDEAYEYMDARTPTDKVVRLMGYFVSQIRHFRSSLFICVPRVKMIDQRIRYQIDRFVRSRLDNSYPGYPFVRSLVTNVHTGKRRKLIIPLNEYGQYYDSWVLLSMRENNLKVNRQDV